MRVIGDWPWSENDFLATQPFKGLVVANMMLNNWDWKTSNNKIYEVARPSGASPSRMYVVRDLGASLGKTSFPRLLNWPPMRGLGQGSRNDLEDFESQGFIKRVEKDTVEFDYRGIHHSMVDALSARDVVWTCRLMARLSDDQWHDAFRAAGYSDDQARRFVVKMKSKVAEGLKLAAGSAEGGHSRAVKARAAARTFTVRGSVRLPCPPARSAKADRPASAG